MHNSHSCYSEVFKTICHTSHGLTMYDEEIHVPLIIWAPFLEGFTAQVRHNVVSALDVVPTLLHMVGLPTSQRHMGRSLVDDLKGEANPDEEIYFESRLSSGVRIGGWKYIFHHKKDDTRTAAWKSGGDGDQELYDLKADPFETRNLIGSKSSVAEKLRASLKRIRTGFQAREEASRGTPWSPTGVKTAKPATDAEIPKPEPAAPPSEPAKEDQGSDEPPASPAEPLPEPGAVAPEVLDGAPTVATKASETDPEPELQAAPVRKIEKPGYLYVALNADKQPRAFRGQIRTEGRFVKLDAFKENHCIEFADSRTIRIRCDLQSNSFRARMAVEPPDSPV